MGRQWKEDSQQHGVEDNVHACSTSYLDGCRLDGRKWMPRVNSEIRESKVDNLRRKGKDLIPTELSLRWEWFDIDSWHRPFPSKDESTNGGRGHQTTKKNAKKADATASTPQAPPLRWRDCVWRRVFAIFRHRHGNLEKTQLRQSKKDVVCLGP